jgi:IS30 family transposase
MNCLLVSLITYYLKQAWSPEQIAGYFKRNFNITISHETIYLYIWADKKKGGTLYLYLRRKAKKYTSRSKKHAGRGCIPNRRDINERPKVVEKKSRIGDWEGDTIIGAQHQGVLLTLVERKSKFTLIEPMNGKNADQVPGLVEGALERLPKTEGAIEELPKKVPFYTMTFDNGKEFAQHMEITKKTGAVCYFATPYHSWERGLSENTNGLIRQYFPKNSNLTKFSIEEIRYVEQQLNNRPRKTLGYRTPTEVLLGIK